MLQIFRSLLIPKVSAMDENYTNVRIGAPGVKTTMEFAVQMNCHNCVKSINSRLSDIKEISKIQISLEKESVIVETTLTTAEIKNVIEKTGKKAILKGIGGVFNGETLGAAVAVVGSTDPKNIGFGWSDSPVCGVVRFIQVNEEECLIEGVLDGLSPGAHGIHIYECGDISQGCNSIGGHYNPMNTRHGSPEQEENNRHVGDLGNIVADQNGHATFRTVDKLVKTWDLIGRSVAVTEREDDLGLGGCKESAIDGNSGQRLACGIIARSSGLFGNPKRICACDGVTIWDEVSGRAKGKVKDGDSIGSLGQPDSIFSEKAKY